MKPDPLDELKDLGPLCSYRGLPQELSETLSMIDRTMAELFSSYEEIEHFEERMSFAWEKMRELIRIAKRRGGLCTELHSDIGCENLDLFDVLLEWVDRVETTIPK